MKTEQTVLEKLNLIGNQILVKPYIPKLEELSKGVILPQEAQISLAKEQEKKDPFKFNTLTVIAVSSELANKNIKVGTQVIIPITRIVNATFVFLNPEDSEDYCVVVPFTDSYVVGYFEE